MGHCMSADFKPLGYQGLHVRRSERALSMFTEDGDIEGSSDSRLPKHLRELEILRIAIVPARHYDRLIYLGKCRRPSFPGLISESLRRTLSRMCCSLCCIPC